MSQLYILRYSAEDKYGDEYYEHEFITADAVERAWFIAGARLADGLVVCKYSDCFECGDEIFSVDIFEQDSLDFWDVFYKDDDWIELLLQWAVENRGVAAALLGAAKRCDPPCERLLQLAPLVAIVEQYQIESEIKANSPGVLQKVFRSL